MNIAVIFAGGVGRRMKTSGLPKQFIKIFNVPIIVHTINNFQNNSAIDKIVVVMLEQYIPYMQTLVNQYHLDKVVSIVKGGQTGQESIYNGLKEAKRISLNKEAIVLIHDGVRPFIEDDLIKRNIESVTVYKSAISAVPCRETIVTVNNDLNVENITNRATSWIARAPQSFYLDDILNAHEQAKTDGLATFIDSCTLMKHYNHTIHLVETCPENIKATTPDDVIYLKSLMEMKDNVQILGVDFKEYRKLLK